MAPGCGPPPCRAGRAALQIQVSASWGDQCLRRGFLRGTHRATGGGRGMDPASEQGLEGGQGWDPTLGVGPPLALLVCPCPPWPFPFSAHSELAALQTAASPQGQPSLLSQNVEAPEGVAFSPVTFSSHCQPVASRWACHSHSRWVARAPRGVGSVTFL